MPARPGALACAASWPAPGWRVLTVNPAEETASLGELPPGVEAVPAQPGVAETFGRPGTWVGDALAQAIGTGAPVVGIVNADIRLDLDAGRRAALMERARTRLVACNRMDLGHPGQQEGPFYRYGYDLLLMPRDMAQMIDLRGFALGVPWWDYWILLDALLQGMPVEVVQCARRAAPGASRGLATACLACRAAQHDGAYRPAPGGGGAPWHGGHRRGDGRHAGRCGRRAG